MNLLLHEQTKLNLASLIANPSQGLLITGDTGAGKGSVALHMVESLISPTQNQHIKIVGQDGSVIPIETIREVIHFTKLTVPGSGIFRRAIVIEHAQHLTNEAQNALLKLLEEPPANTLLILTASRPSDLLPTISSRLQTLAILPIKLQDALDYYNKTGHLNEEITPNYHISGGNMGLLTALLGQTTDHPLVIHISLAKQILRYTKFEKVALIDKLITQKEDIGSILLALMRVSRAAMQQAIAVSNTNSIDRWKRTLRSIISAQDNIVTKPNNKLLLTELMLNL